MIKNYYYLVVGLLAILFAFTHSWNGQTTVLPTLDYTALTAETKTTFIYIWNIITAENLVFGIAFVLMSVHKDLSKVRFTAIVIASIMILRLIVINGANLLYNPTGLGDTSIDSFVIIAYVALIILGTRVKDPKLNG